MILKKLPKSKKVAVSFFGLAQKEYEKGISIFKHVNVKLLLLFPVSYYAMFAKN